MSKWQGRTGGATPRFKPVLLAIPLGIFLLFTTITGHVDLIRAFDSDAGKIDRLLQQKAVIESTVVAQATESAAAQFAPAQPENTTMPTSAATATSTPTDCEASSDGLYCRYTVQEGDSLAAIATRFGLDGGAVPGWQLIFESNKLDLADIDAVLVPGGVIVVPASIGVLHLILPGDSLSALAQDYDVSIDDIAAVNGLTDADNVQIGDILFVPSPAQIPPPPALDLAVEEETPEAELEPAETPEVDESEADEPEGTTEAEETTGPEETPESDETSEPEATEERASDAPETDDAENDEAEDPSERRDPSRSRDDGGEDEGDADDENEPSDAEVQSQAVPDDATSMSWPVVQPVSISNYMTARHPLGMDFGLFANPRSSIMAAAGGTVIFAGGDPCCSYGYYVIVDHGNGLQTLYAHFSSIAVQKGETVSRGQALGIAGATGYAFGVHLHFEVYKDGKRVDPMRYLPGN